MNDSLLYVKKSPTKTKTFRVSGIFTIKAPRVDIDFWSGVGIWKLGHWSERIQRVSEYYFWAGDKKFGLRQWYSSEILKKINRLKVEIEFK